MKATAFGAALMISAAALYTPAHAADLGGDCCADLEERVAELESTTARKGNRKVSLTIYGQVNEALSFWDNGHETNVYQLTSDASRSRFGFKGKAKISDDLFAKFKIEIGIRSASQKAVDEGFGPGDDGGAAMDLRHTSWTLGSKTYGSVTVGETGFATEGITQVNLGKHGHFASNDVTDWNRDYQLIRPGSNGQSVGVDWGDITQVAEPGEGSRGNVVRYDSPVFNGFKLSASWGEDDVASLGARYAGKFGDFKFAAAAGYSWISERDEECTDDTGPTGNAECREFGVSASVYHKVSGLFLTGSYGFREDEAKNTVAAANGLNLDDRAEFYHISGGWQQKISALGLTTFYGEYHDRQNGTPLNDKTGALKTANGNNILSSEWDMWGLGINQHIDASAMDIYLAYRHFDADIKTTGGDVDTEAWQAVVTGARIKF